MNKPYLLCHTLDGIVFTPRDEAARDLGYSAKTMVSNRRSVNLANSVCLEVKGPGKNTPAKEVGMGSIFCGWIDR